MKTVLIISDNKQQLQALEIALKHFGHEVMGAEDLEESIYLVDDCQVEHIIMCKSSKNYQNELEILKTCKLKPVLWIASDETLDGAQHLELPLNPIHLAQEIEQY